MDPRLFLPCFEHYAVSPTSAYTLKRTNNPLDINRLHPTHSSSGNLSNVQASATGLILENTDASSSIKARVLIVNNTAERGSGGYVGLMNSVFAAQKRVSSCLELLDSSREGGRRLC
jgi:hypothetical protein